MLKIKDNDGMVTFIMRVGNDFVKSQMTLGSAMNILSTGKETETVDPNYPIAVDDKYFFEAEPVYEENDKKKKGKR